LLPLDCCILIYGRWILEIGTIEPGQRIIVDKKTPRRELRELLFSKEASSNETLRRIAAYNPQSIDWNYITQVLSFHNALGGYETTGLHNTFRKSLDMSGLLTVDRAVLIGTAREPAEAEKEQQKITSVHLTKPGEHSSLKTGVKRLLIVRQSLPVTLTELSPRLKSEQNIIKRDELEDRTKDIQGPDQYSPGF
jgi:hypothetical protein